MEREQEEQVQPATTSGYAGDWTGTVDQGAGEVSGAAVNFCNP